MLLCFVILLRLFGTMCSFFYGPYMYLVLGLAGAYIAADIVLLYSLAGQGKATEKPKCDFSEQKVWSKYSTNATFMCCKCHY